MKKLFIFIYFFSYSYFLFAQNKTYLKNLSQAFENQPEFNETIYSNFTNYPAVILLDKTDWKINDQNNTTVVKKHMRIKFLSPEALPIYSKITVPETLDSLREYADLPVKNRNKVHRPKYYNLELLNFNARILRNQKIVPIIAANKVESEALTINGNLKHAYSYEFDCNKNLQVGDVLDIEYQYYIDKIFSYHRQFFNGNLPKQKFELNLTYNSHENFYFNFGPNSTPSNINKTTKAPYHTTYTWKKENLQGGINQIGAIPYKDMPFVSYYIHNKLYGITDSNSEIKDYKEYSWNYFADNVIQFKLNNNSKKNRKLSPADIALSKFYNSKTKEVADTQYIKKLYLLHSIIADSFAITNQADHFSSNYDYLSKTETTSFTSPQYKGYIHPEISRGIIYKGIFDLPNQDDRDYEYTTWENFSKKIPQSLSNKTLKNTNIFKVYTGLLNLNQQLYFKVFINDKRIDQINPDHCFPIFGENKLLSTLINNNIFWILPKTNRMGLALNELPFYLENTPSVHILQMANSYMNVTENVKFFKSPASTEKHNYRHILKEININYSRKSATTNSKIILSGQFSTLLRGYYFYGTIDSSISPLYYQAIDTSNTTFVSLEPEHPFRCEFKQTNTINNIISFISDSMYTLNLNKLLINSILPNITAKYRTQPFYPDFLFEDTQQLTISFDKTIKIKPFKDLPLIINNSFGTLNFAVEQVNNTTIQVILKLVVKAEKIDVEKIVDVETITSLLEKISLNTIKINITP